MQIVAFMRINILKNIIKNIFCSFFFFLFPSWNGFDAAWLITSPSRDD